RAGGRRGAGRGRGAGAFAPDRPDGGRGGVGRDVRGRVAGRSEQGDDAAAGGDVAGPVGERGRGGGRYAERPGPVRGGVRGRGGGQQRAGAACVGGGAGGGGGSWWGAIR